MAPTMLHPQQRGTVRSAETPNQACPGHFKEFACSAHLVELDHGAIRVAHEDPTATGSELDRATAQGDARRG